MTAVENCVAPPWPVDTVLRMPSRWRRPALPRICSAHSVMRMSAVALTGLTACGPPDGLIAMPARS
jgi:hypothetical protein